MKWQESDDGPLHWRLCWVLRGMVEAAAEAQGDNPWVIKAQMHVVFAGMISKDASHLYELLPSAFQIALKEECCSL